MHEGAVDLHHVHAEQPKVTERRVAGAEIVHGDPDAKRLYALKQTRGFGAFVQNLASSIDDRFFVRTLAALARHLGITTVAEWVEDEETCRLLGDWDVDYLQGYYIGRAETDLTAEARALAATRASA